MVAGREDQLFLILTLAIGAIVGLIVVAFILVTERFGARLYPENSAAWRRVLFPKCRLAGNGIPAVPIFSGRAGKPSRIPVGSTQDDKGCVDWI
jgi:hypothetical protein